MTTKSFREVTADELRAYEGEVYRATLVWRGEGGNMSIDIEESSMVHLSRWIGEACRKYPEKTFWITYGPHSEKGKMTLASS